MEVKTGLIDRITEEEFWLVEIKFGGIMSMTSVNKSLKTPQGVCD